MKHSRFVQIILFLTVTSFFFTGLISLLCTQIPYEWVKLQMDVLSVDGDAERFTPSVYAQITTKLYLLGLITLCFSILTFLYKTTITHFLKNGLSVWTMELRTFCHDAIQYIRSIHHDTDRAHIIALYAFIIGGIVFRLFFLFQPIRHDEAFTFTNYASKPLILGLSNYSFPNNHLFHTLCVHISYFLFGNQLWAIRLPAFLASILLLPVTYYLVRALYNKHSALITTTCLTVSSALIEYGTNARGYALMMLFFMLLLLLATYLRKKNNVAAWIILATFSALGLHTVPVMLYPFATLLLWIILSAWQKDFSLSFKATIYRVLLYGTLTICLTGMLYLPVILASGLDAIIQNRFVQPMTLSSFIDHLPERLWDVWSQWSHDYNTSVATLLVIATCFGIMTHKQFAKHRICLALPAVLSLAILLPIQGVLPPERVWLYLLPLFFMIASTGFFGFLQRVASISMLPKATILFSLGFGMWSGLGAIQTLNHYYPYGPGTLKDAEAITQFLKPQFQSSDRLLTIATAAPLEYYFKKHDVAIDYLRQDITQGNRLIVLVLENKYTLDQVLNVARISRPDYTPPHLLHVYPSARLYEMKRIITARQSNDQNLGYDHDDRN